MNGTILKQVHKACDWLINLSPTKAKAHVRLNEIVGQTHKLQWDNSTLTMRSEVRNHPQVIQANPQKKSYPALLKGYWRSTRTHRHITPQTSVTQITMKQTCSAHSPPREQLKERATASHPHLGNHSYVWRKLKSENSEGRPYRPLSIMMKLLMMKRGHSLRMHTLGTTGSGWANKNPLQFQL